MKKHVIRAVRSAMVLFLVICMLCVTASAYTLNSEKRYLTSDDKSGIHAIYGSKAAGSTVSASADDSDDCVDGVQNVLISGMLPAYNLDDLVEKASIIVKAHAEPESQVVEIKPANGGDSRNFTNYTFTVSECLYGDVSQGDQITVRVQGGRNEHQNTICEDAPAITAGQDVILFLRKPELGGGYATTGDYYSILGVNQGIYYAAGEADAEDAYINEEGEEISCASVLRSIEQKPALTSDRMSEYEEFKQNLQSTLENGVITQEGYDQILADSNQYAEIVN